MEIHYKISFYSFWHASSGLSGGVYADSLVIKDRNNYPYLPGKTIKGLLRDSAKRIISYSGEELIAEQFLRSVFGDEPNPKELENESPTVEGTAFFDNAYLSDYIQYNLANQENDLTNHFYKIHSATKINRQGVAVDGSLRSMEVVIPLTLYGAIVDFPEGENHLRMLTYCMQGVKRLGLNRNRGLGRCKFSILDNKA